MVLPEVERSVSVPLLFGMVRVAGRSGHLPNTCRIGSLALQESLPSRRCKGNLLAVTTPSAKSEFHFLWVQYETPTKESTKK